MCSCVAEAHGCNISDRMRCQWWSRHLSWAWRLNMLRTFTCMILHVTVTELCLTLCWECPAAGRLFSEFGPFWKWQCDRHDDSLARSHRYWRHFFPGSWFRQRGGFGRTRGLCRYRVCALVGDGELDKREIWVFGLNKSKEKATLTYSVLSLSPLIQSLLAQKLLGQINYTNVYKM